MSRASTVAVAQHDAPACCSSLSVCCLPFVALTHFCCLLSAACRLLRWSAQILSNFGVDVLEALSSTCTLYTQSSIGTMQLASDLLVAFLLITAHGSVLMCQVCGWVWVGVCLPGTWGGGVPGCEQGVQVGRQTE